MSYYGESIIYVTEKIGSKMLPIDVVTKRNIRDDVVIVPYSNDVVTKCNIRDDVVIVPYSNDEDF